MNTKDEALRLALEALEHFEKAGLATLKTIDAITAIKQALAQPEPEPVACPFPCGWKNLFSIIIKDGAFLARSLVEDEVVTSHQRETVMRLIDYAKTMALHGINTSPPKRKPLPPQSPCEMTQAEYKIFKLAWLECEAAHGIKGEA